MGKGKMERGPWMALALLADHTGGRQEYSDRFPVSDHRTTGMLNGFLRGLRRRTKIEECTGQTREKTGNIRTGKTLNFVDKNRNATQFLHSPGVSGLCPGERLVTGLASALFACPATLRPCFRFSVRCFRDEFLPVGLEMRS